MRSVFIITLLLLAGSAQATTLAVCPSGCHYTTIQSAIDASSPDDIIEIHSGNYKENIALRKEVTIKGIDTGGKLPLLEGILYLCGHDEGLITGLTYRIINSGTPESDTNVFGSITFGKPDSTLSQESKNSQTSKGLQDAIARFNDGLALNKLGKYSDAVIAYDEAIRLNPQYAEAWNGKGIALANHGKFEESLKCFDKSIEIKQSYASAWFDKAHVLNVLSRYTDAIECCDKAIELEPKEPSYWNEKGVSLYNLKEYYVAVESFDEAIQLSPKRNTYWANKGFALKALGKIAEAEAAFARAKELGYTG